MFEIITLLARLQPFLSMYYFCQLALISETFTRSLPISIVVIPKRNEKTGKAACVVIFSTDLELATENLVKSFVSVHR